MIHIAICHLKIELNPHETPDRDLRMNVCASASQSASQPKAIHDASQRKEIEKYDMYEIGDRSVRIAIERDVLRRF